MLCAFILLVSCTQPDNNKRLLQTAETATYEKVIDLREWDLSPSERRRLMGPLIAVLAPVMLTADGVVGLIDIGITGGVWLTMSVSVMYLECGSSAVLHLGGFSNPFKESIPGVPAAEQALWDNGCNSNEVVESFVTGVIVSGVAMGIARCAGVNIPSTARIVAEWAKENAFKAAGVIYRGLQRDSPALANLRTWMTSMRAIRWSDLTSFIRTANSGSVSLHSMTAAEAEEASATISHMSEVAHAESSIEANVIGHQSLDEISVHSMDSFHSVSSVGSEMSEIHVASSLPTRMLETTIRIVERDGQLHVEDDMCKKCVNEITVVELKKPVRFPPKFRTVTRCSSYQELPCSECIGGETCIPITEVTGQNVGPWSGLGSGRRELKEEDFLGQEEEEEEGEEEEGKHRKL